MAASRLPEPGTDAGPCPTTCKHRDCAETRRMAKERCAHCCKPIGYDEPYFDHPLRHERCVMLDRSMGLLRSYFGG